MFPLGGRVFARVTGNGVSGRRGLKTTTTTSGHLGLTDSLVSLDGADLETRYRQEAWKGIHSILVDRKLFSLGRDTVNYSC